MRPVQIGTVDTAPRTDADTNSTTRTELVIYPLKRMVELDQTSRAKSEQQVKDRKSGIVLAYTLSGRPEADMASAFLAGDSGQSLLACICDGHEITGVGG